MMWFSFLYSMELIISLISHWQLWIHKVGKTSAKSQFYDVSLSVSHLKVAAGKVTLYLMVNLIAYVGEWIITDASVNAPVTMAISISADFSINKGRINKKTYNHDDFIIFQYCPYVISSSILVALEFTMVKFFMLTPCVKEKMTSLLYGVIFLT